MFDDKMVTAGPGQSRCHQMNGKGFQCQFVTEPNSNYCSLHGGNRATDLSQYKQENRAFRLAQWQTRLQEFTDNPNVKTLREEIGISRITLENILLLCQDSNDILLYSNKISDVLRTTQKLVESCHRIENQLGMTLDKSAAMGLAEQIITIIGEHITDDQVMESVATKISEALLNTNRVKELANGTS
jgi:hypothetical protein